MSIEQLEIRPDSVQKLIEAATLPGIIVQPAADEAAERCRKDQLFNLSGRATGLNKLPLDARQGLRRLVMRYNVANE